eukprot:TRINITY_DN6409_c2_g1_i1.p1 TRINITY_DN6409_c2_g1~~TRINITY_DN6409_c2_g1_i1.p1  ORF type:complete len:203 (-),score=-14.53 TRINITY_DN6409_c2_g1_i1:91-699(-)
MYQYCNNYQQKVIVNYVYYFNEQKFACYHYQYKQQFLCLYYHHIISLYNITVKYQYSAYINIINCKNQFNINNNSDSHALINNQGFYIIKKLNKKQICCIIALCITTDSKTKLINANIQNYMIICIQLLGVIYSITIQDYNHSVKYKYFFRSASAKLYQQTSMSPSPRIIRPRRVLTTVGAPRLGRVKGNVMTAIEVVPDAP